MRRRQLESSLERRVVRWAEERNILNWKLNVTGRRGIPDRIFFINGGRPILMEFKRKGEKLQKLQEYTINLLYEAGYNVAVTDDYDAAVCYLSQQIHKIFRA